MIGGAEVRVAGGGIIDGGGTFVVGGVGGGGSGIFASVDDEGGIEDGLWIGADICGSVEGRD